MGYGDQFNPLERTEIIYTINSRLPGQLQDRWNRNTLQLRRKYARKLKLIDLANFVEDKMKLWNKSLYSRDAISQYIEKIPRSNSWKKINTFATIIEQIDDPNNQKKKERPNYKIPTMQVVLDHNIEVLRKSFRIKK